MKRFIETYAKAIVAFVAPCLTDFAATIQGPGPIDLVAFARRSCVYIIGALVVWAVPNTPQTLHIVTNNITPPTPPLSADIQARTAA